MRVIITLAAAFVLWQAISKRIPVLSRKDYHKAAEKWSTVLPRAAIGLLDFISLSGLLILAITSFFAMPIVSAILFCAILIVLWLLPGLQYAHQQKRALGGKPRS